MKRFKIVCRSCHSQFDVLQNRSSLKWSNMHRKTSGLYRTHPVAAFMSTRKGGRGKRGTMEREKEILNERRK